LVCGNAGSGKTLLITGIDSQKLLNQAIAVASKFEPLAPDTVRHILSRTREAAQGGKYELFKTSAHFDATARHPEWLGEELPAVERLAKTA